MYLTCEDPKPAELIEAHKIKTTGLTFFEYKHQTLDVWFNFHGQFVAILLLLTSYYFLCPKL